VFVPFLSLQSVSNPTGNVTMEWCYVSTVGNHTLYNITGLLSDTLYQVEVVSVLGSKKFSQPAMSSFRTGDLYYFNLPNLITGITAVSTLQG